MSRWSPRALKGTALVLLLLLGAIELGPFRETHGAGILFLLLGAGAAAVLAWLRGWVFEKVWSRATPRSHPATFVENAAVVLLVLAPSIVLFREAWGHGGYSRYDWAPHHANLRHLVDGLARGHVPRWVLGVSTGDSPYELYPLFPYYLAARAALLFDVRDLTLVLVRSGLFIHTLGAVGAALLARRVIGWKWGVVVGWITLFDLGSAFTGGLNGVLYLGVTHSALATALWSFVLVGVLDALERPSLSNSLYIWSLATLALVCHPISALSAAATVGALVLVACLANDVPRYRAWVAIGHVALGLSLAAFVWMPFGERVLLYGLHYAWPADTVSHFFADLLEHPQPLATLAPLVAVAYVGIVVGLLSRRAAPTLVACHAALLLCGLVDQLYFLLDLLPSLEMARLPAARLGSLGKVTVYVSAAYLLALALGHVARRWSGKERLVTSAVVAFLAFPFLRSGLAYFGDLTRELVAETHPDVPDGAGFRDLIAWARTEARAERPEAYGRLLSDDHERYYSVYHVHAETGLPGLWIGSAAALFLRERLEDASPASLARFDVRWVVHHDAPPSVGDPATERHFGSYYVRELPSWDGRFARVERGHGRAVVTRLEDERIDVDLQGTDAPALVALGMGYYPRWQAQHATRGQLPVYAYPATPGSALSVPAAWLPPGHTTFQPTGRLSSDGQGGVVSALGLIVALGSAISWRLPRVRLRVLRAAARGRRILPRWRRAIVETLLAVFATVLVVTSALSAGRATRALEVGNGLFPRARVEERAGDGSFRDCVYAWLDARYHCPSGARVYDVEGQLLNDAEPSTPLITPAIRIDNGASEHEFRIVLTARLQGEYWAQTNAPKASITTNGTRAQAVTAERSSVTYAPDAAPQTVTIASVLGDWTTTDLTFVRRRTVEPRRNYPEAPPTSPFP